MDLSQYKKKQGQTTTFRSSEYQGKGRPKDKDKLKLKAQYTNTAVTYNVE